MNNKAVQTFAKLADMKRREKSKAQIKEAHAKVKQERAHQNSKVLER